MCQERQLFSQLLSREKEQRAEQARLQRDIDCLNTECSRLHEAHRALREQCEMRHIDVGPAARSELTELDEDAEVSLVIYVSSFAYSQHIQRCNG